MRPMSETTHLPSSVNGNKCSQWAFQKGLFQRVKRLWWSQFYEWRGSSRILYSCLGVGGNQPFRRCLLPLYRFQRAARRHISAWNPWDHRVSYLSTAGDEKLPYYFLKPKLQAAGFHLHSCRHTLQPTKHKSRPAPRDMTQAKQAIDKEL